MEKLLRVVVRSIITPEHQEGGDPECPTDTNATMQDIRSRLEESAGVFMLTESGFGDVIVNSSGIEGSVTEIKSGPKPQTLKWHAIAGHAAAEIVWACDLVLPPCSRDTGLKSLAYSLIFSINQKGFTTKTVRGTIQVAQSVVSGVAVSADEFRDRIVVQRSANCHREQDYNLSPCRSRLDFSIIDKEIESPNAFPHGVVSISAPLRIRIPYPQGGEVVGRHSVNVRVELEATTERTRAWEIFVAIFNARIAAYVAGNDTPVVVTDLAISEDWFTHEYSFAVEFTVTKNFKNLLIESGLFKAFPVDWVTWSASMASVQRSRGIAQFKYSAAVQDDPLMSLCDSDEDRVETVTLEATEYFRSIGTFAILCNDQPPPPEKSWLKYDSQTIEATSYNRKLIQTYGKDSKAIDEFDPSSTASGGEMTTVTDDSTNPPTQSVADGVAGQYWIWKGHAQRIGYPIPKFGKTRVGETDVEVIGEPRVMRRLVGYLFCQPIYEVVWCIGLVATETPTPADNEGDPTETNSDYPEPEVVDP